MKDPDKKKKSKAVMDSLLKLIGREDMSDKMIYIDPEDPEDLKKLEEAHKNPPRKPC